MMQAVRWISALLAVMSFVIGAKEAGINFPMAAGIAVWGFLMIVDGKETA